MPPVPLVGDGLCVPCVDGRERRHVGLDNAASTAALPAVAARVADFLPWYSSVHRGAGYKSQMATREYEGARATALAFAGREGGGDVAIICRNTTEAINHLAYRLPLTPGDVVITTVVEHHANLLPWGRVATRRYVECGTEGTFSVEAVEEALDERPRPALLAVTGASNVTGWLPPIDDVIAAAHRRGVPVLVDAAQLAPHRPLPRHADFLVWSGHKMYAPYGAGILLGPRSVFSEGDPFLAGGGAVDLVGLDEVVWTRPPEREEAGSPNVVGAVALGAAMKELTAIGWAELAAHEGRLGRRLRDGLSAIPGVTLLGPRAGTPTLAVAAFAVAGMHHALVAARLSAEFGIATRHGCFCAHPYLLRLLGLGEEAMSRHREAVRAGDHRDLPGAVRASAGLGTTADDIDALVAAVASLVDGRPSPVEYRQEPTTGDFHPLGVDGFWADRDRAPGLGCARG